MESETDVRARGGAGGPGARAGPAHQRSADAAAGSNPLTRRRSSSRMKGPWRSSTRDAATAARCSCRAPRRVARRRTDAGLPQITFAIEHYGRIVRTMEKDEPVTLEMDIKNTFYDDIPQSFNVVGEIPGTDKADEIVMLGAHFDSWHGGTGATDNAAGSAVMMEAMRILKQRAAAAAHRAHRPLGR